MRLLSFLSEFAMKQQPSSIYHGKFRLASGGLRFIGLPGRTIKMTASAVPHPITIYTPDQTQALVPNSLRGRATIPREGVLNIKGKNGIFRTPGHFNNPCFLRLNVSGNTLNL